MMNYRAITLAVSNVLEVGTAYRTFSDIIAERLRQVVKWGVQRHRYVSPRTPDGYYGKSAENYKRHNDTAHETGADFWDLILLEEVYEALEQAELGDLRAFRTELIQVMAVAAAMIENIEVDLQEAPPCTSTAPAPVSTETAAGKPA